MTAPRDDRPIGVAVRRYYTSPRTHDDFLESHLELWDRSDPERPRLLPGYGWVFGMGDGTSNVGLGVLSTRVLYFERGPDRGFIAPEHYESEAQINASTHDLPTVRGFWRGLDILWRDRIDGNADPSRREADLAERGRDRERLLATLRHHGALTGEAGADAGSLPTASD